MLSRQGKHSGSVVWQAAVHCGDVATVVGIAAAGIVPMIQTTAVAGNLVAEPASGS